MITLNEIKLISLFEPEECATCGHIASEYEMEFHFTSEDESSYSFFCNQECFDDYNEFIN